MQLIRQLESKGMKKPSRLLAFLDLKFLDDLGILRIGSFLVWE